MAGARTSGVERLREQERELREADGRGREDSVVSHGAHGIEVGALPSEAHAAQGLAEEARGPLARLAMFINRIMLFFGMVALVVASLILTYSVVSRYILHA